MLRTNYDPVEFLKIVDEVKGYDTYRSFALKRCGLKSPTHFYLIKSGDYKPGYKLILRIANAAAPEKRNETYFRLLKAAGLWCEDLSRQETYPDIVTVTDEYGHKHGVILAR